MLIISDLLSILYAPAPQKLFASTRMRSLNSSSLTSTNSKKLLNHYTLIPVDLICSSLRYFGLCSLCNALTLSWTICQISSEIASSCVHHRHRSRFCSFRQFPLRLYQQTYRLLHEWDINAVIPLNPNNTGNFKYPPALSVNDNGIPICLGGHQMVRWGFNKNRCRIKYRCPLACGKIESCSCKDKCYPSKYGRVIYIKQEWDLRLITRIPRNSKLWRHKYKCRTCAERVNNRVLNYYGVDKNHRTKNVFLFSL